MVTRAPDKPERRVLYAPVPPPLHRKARYVAIAQRRSVGSLVQEAVERYLATLPSETEDAIAAVKLSG